MAVKGRYWVYVHDKEGVLVKDLGEFDDYYEAVDAAIDEGLSEDIENVTARVVDKDHDSMTVWMAGPVKAEAS